MVRQLCYFRHAPKSLSNAPDYPFSGKPKNHKLLILKDFIFTPLALSLFLGILIHRWYPSLVVPQQYQRG